MRIACRTPQPWYPRVEGAGGRQLDPLIVPRRGDASAGPSVMRSTWCSGGSAARLNVTLATEVAQSNVTLALTSTTGTSPSQVNEVFRPGFCGQNSRGDRASHHLALHRPKGGQCGHGRRGVGQPGRSARPEPLSGLWRRCGTGTGTGRAPAPAAHRRRYPPPCLRVLVEQLRRWPGYRGDQTGIEPALVACDATEPVGGPRAGRSCPHSCTGSAKRHPGRCGASPHCGCSASRKGHRGTARKQGIT